MKHFKKQSNKGDLACKNSTNNALSDFIILEEEGSREWGFLIYSTKEGQYMDKVITVIQDVTDRFGFDIKKFDDLPSGKPLTEIIDFIKKGYFGVVVLDGLRPNVCFEYGALVASGLPIILLIEKNAQINIRQFYLDVKIKPHKGLKKLKLDPSKHITDIGGVLIYKEYNRKKLKKRRSIRRNDCSLEAVLEAEFKRRKNEIFENKLIPLNIKGSKKSEEVKKFIKELVKFYLDNEKEI